MKFLRKVKDSAGPGGVAHSAESQNLKLDWPSVWGGKSLKFFRKIKDSGGPGGGYAPRGLAESEPSVRGGKSLKFFKKIKNSGRPGGLTDSAHSQNLSLERGPGG